MGWVLNCRYAAPVLEWNETYIVELGHDDMNMMNEDIVIRVLNAVQGNPLWAGVVSREGLRVTVDVRYNSRP